VTSAEVDLLNRQRLVARLLPATVHDARNALQGISGTAELVTMGPADGGGHTDTRVRSILRQASWVGARLEQLLKLGLESQFHAERLDVGRMCQSVIDLRKASWGRQGISAVVPSPGLTIHSDVTATMRLLLNLVVNAETSLLQRGGGEIRLTAEVVDAALMLVIDDGGGGVTEESEPWLFSTRTHAGTLATGLPAARRLAERLGGALTWLGPTRRSAFAVQLPLGR
jgi:K+-sensing histidine kinase KdpD